MPTGGILCFSCITKRIQEAGLSDVPMIMAAGPYKKDEDYKISYRNGSICRARLHVRDQALGEHQSLRIKRISSISRPELLFNKLSRQLSEIIERWISSRDRN